MTLVRLMTLRSATLARWFRISSWTPSAKNAFRFSSLRFSKGRTAMLLSGTCASVGLSETAREIPDELLRRRTKKLKAKAMAANATAVIYADHEKSSGKTGRAPAPAERDHTFLHLSFVVRGRVSKISFHRMR